MSEFREDPRFLRWDFIEKIADNELSKIVGIIPMVGYLILFNDKIADALSFNSIVGVDDTAVSPFLLCSICKLRLAFFGSILVLIANITFKLRSPKILAQSKSDLDFSDRVVNSYSQSEIAGIEEQVLSEDWVWRIPLDTYAAKISQRLTRKNPTISRPSKDKNRLIAEQGDFIRALSREWWAGENHSNRIARWITLMFSILGYAMLALPTLDIAQAVIRDIFLAPF